MIPALTAAARSFRRDPIGELIGSLRNQKVSTFGVSFGATGTAFKMLSELGVTGKADSQFIVRVLDRASLEELGRVPSYADYNGSTYPVLLQIVSDTVTPGRLTPVRYQMAGSSKAAVSHADVMARYRAEEG